MNSTFPALLTLTGTATIAVVLGRITDHPVSETVQEGSSVNFTCATVRCSNMMQVLHYLCGGKAPEAAFYAPHHVFSLSSSVEVSRASVTTWGSDTNLEMYWVFSIGPCLVAVSNEDLIT